MAKLVINIAAEKIKKKHIARNMTNSAVQKGVCYKLPKKRLGRIELKHFNPWAELHSNPLAWNYHYARMVAQQKYNNVNRYQSIVGVGDFVVPYIRSYW